MAAIGRSVSTSRTATLGPPAPGAALETSRPDSMPFWATPHSGTAAPAAMELMRKSRLFICNFHLESRAVHMSMARRPLLSGPFDHGDARPWENMLERKRFHSQIEIGRDDGIEVH